MATIELAATTREERGSHNKPLRREGLVPAVLYGHNVVPRAIVAPAGLLHRVWMRAGRTQLNVWPSRARGMPFHRRHR